MTKSYCTACACYKKRTQTNTRKRECLHPEWGRKMEFPRVPDWCGLEIKHRLTPENSFAFVPYQIDGKPPINDVRIVLHD